MIRHTIQFILLSILPLVTKASLVYGSLGNLVIPIEFQFGPDSMVVSSHVPPSAPATLHSSVNLHIFSKQLVAVRDEQFGGCFVRSFNATMEEMKQRVQDAFSHQGDLGGVKEEVIFTDLLTPLPQKVAARFGNRISQFCSSLPVYFVNDRNSIILKSSDFLSNNRVKRQTGYRADFADVIDGPRTGGGKNILKELVVC